MANRINSRKKGAAGEREAAHFLNSLGFTARRAVQNGVTDGRDIVVDDLPNVYFEVKRDQSVSMESQSLDDAMEQAQMKKPIAGSWAVLWRRDRECWKMTFRGERGIVTAHHRQSIKENLVRLNAESTP